MEATTSRKGPSSTWGTVTGPDSYVVHGMPYSGPILEGAQEGDVIPVVFGKPDSWRQPLGLGMAGAGLVSFPLSFFTQPYAFRLPSQTAAWPEQGQDGARQRRTANDFATWFYNGNSFPLASCKVATTPRCYKNRALMIVSGGDDDDLVSDKITNVSPLSPARSSVTDPWFLRVCHVDIYGEPVQTSPTRDGNPGNLEDNLRIFDISLVDANRTGLTSGITQVATETAKRVVPVDVSIRPFYPEGYEPLSPTPDDRCQMLVSWVAPQDQAGTDGGNRFAVGDETEPQYLSDGSDGRFFVSLHHVNTRSKYKVAGSIDNYLTVAEQPTLFDNGSFEQPDAPAGAYEMELVPSQETVRIWELPYCPISSPIWFDGGSLLAGQIWILCAKNTTETSSGLEPGRLEELHWVRLDVSAEVIADDILVELDTPDPGFLIPAAGKLSFFEKDKPPTGVPWFGTEVFGEDYQNGWGFIDKLGKYQNVLSINVDSEAGEARIVIPQVSYSSQVVAWRITPFTVDLEWELKGWTNYPTPFQVYSTCGALDVHGDPTVLVHFEEWSKQSASGLFALGTDLSGHIFYETLAPNVPLPGDGDEYFDPTEWPPDGLPSAYATISGTGQLSDGGDPDDTEELQDIFQWTIDYWIARNDPDGWYNVDTDHLPLSHRQGLMLLDVLTGDELDSDYLDWEEKTIRPDSGSLQGAYYISEFCPGPDIDDPTQTRTDPLDVDDVYGPVYDRSDTPIGGPLRSNKFGFEPDDLDTVGHVLIHKVWSVRYDGPDLSGYDPGIFDYLNSMPSQVGEGLGDSGQKGVQIDLGIYSGPASDPDPMTYWAKFDDQAWGVRFIVRRLWVERTEYPYYAGKELNCLSFLRTATNEVKIAFLCRTFSNIRQSDFEAATASGLDLLKGIPVSVRDTTLDPAYPDTILTETINVTSDGGGNLYSLKYGDMAGPLFHGRPFGEQVEEDRSVWFMASQEFGGSDIIMVSPQDGTCLTWHHDSMDLGKLLGGLDDLVSQAPNDLVIKTDEGYATLSDSYLFTIGGNDGSSHTRVMIHHLQAA